MLNLRKRKNSSSSTRPSKKIKLVSASTTTISNNDNDIDNFLDDDSDSDDGNASDNSQNIDDIINQVIEEEKDIRNASDNDIDLDVDHSNKKYDTLDEFYSNDLNDEFDEFDEGSFIMNNKNNKNNNNQITIDDNDILGLNDDDDDDLLPIEKQTQKDLELKKQIQKDVADDIYEEIGTHQDTLTTSFIFPSYRRLLIEKKSAPNLDRLKERISNVLEVLSSFRILRDNKHSRREYISLLSHSLSRYYGYNIDLMNMFLTLFSPSECLAFLESNEISRAITIRTNTLKCRRRDLAKLLINRGINLDPLSNWSKSGLKICGQPNIPIGATPEYLSGYYMIQSAASLLPVLSLDIQLNNRVLDMCSAPGGKTTHIAQLLRDSDTGFIVANDVNNARLKAVYGNIHRMGLKNIIITNIDGRYLDKHFHPIFDRVLLDAPCSCLGIISRDPSIKYSKTFTDVIKMSTLQKELILTAIDCCIVGGYIVYSTCSISPYENESVISHALQNRYIKIVDTNLPFGVNGFTKFKHMKFHNDLKKTKRYYPHKHNLDGFYVAKLYKCDKGKKGIKKIKQQQLIDNNDNYNTKKKYKKKQNKFK